MSRQQIQGTALWLEKSRPLSDSQHIQLFDDRLDFGDAEIAHHPIVTVINQEWAAIWIKTFPKQYLSSSDARVMAAALQQAATIAADFDTWWEQP